MDPIKNYFMDKMQFVIMNFNKSHSKRKAEQMIEDQKKIISSKKFILPLNKSKKFSMRNMEY